MRSLHSSSTNPSGGKILSNGSCSSSNTPHTRHTHHGSSSSLATHEFNSVFRHMNDNVRKLQMQLKETQSTMKRLSERAQTLKQSAPTTPRQRQESRAAVADLEQKHRARQIATKPAKTREDEKSESEMQPRDAMTQTSERDAVSVPPVQHQQQQQESVVEEAIGSEQKRRQEQEQQQLLQQQVTALQGENVVLRQTITEHESSMSLVIQRAMERVEQLKQQNLQQRRVFDTELAKERALAEEMRGDNELLREKMRRMVQVMQEAAATREREMQDTDAHTLRLWKENQMLRQMLMLSDKDMSRCKEDAAEDSIIMS